MKLEQSFRHRLELIADLVYRKGIATYFQAELASSTGFSFQLQVKGDWHGLPNRTFSENSSDTHVSPSWVARLFSSRGDIEFQEA